MKEKILGILDRIKKICYPLLRGVLMPKEKDPFHTDGLKGLLLEGALMTLVLVMALLVLMMAGGGIEEDIKEVIDALSQ